MDSLTILDNIQIASPCDVEWDQMTGDDRTRFCSSCSKHVYNIMAMTADQAKELIAGTEGQLCVRIYRRHDGTVLTADCPVGLGKIAAGRRLRRALTAALVLPGLLIAGAAAMGISKRQEGLFPGGPISSWDDLVDRTLVALGIRQPPRATMGFMISDFSSISSKPAPTGTPECTTEPVPTPPPAAGSPFDLTPPSAPSKPVVDQ